MPADYLHNHPQFADLIRIVAQEKGIDPALAEKDYWCGTSIATLISFRSIRATLNCRKCRILVSL